MNKFNIRKFCHRFPAVTFYIINDINTILLLSYARQGGGDMPSKEGRQPNQGLQYDDEELQDAITFWRDMQKTAEEKLKELQETKQKDNNI